MRQRFARVLPVARRGGDPDPETAPGGAIGARAGQDAAVRRSRSHHRLRRQHAAAGLHQRNPDQPNLEQGFYSAAGQPGLALALSRARALSRPREGGTHNHQFRFCEGWSRSECNNTHRWLWAPAFARATNQVECAMMARPTFSSSLFAPRNDGVDGPRTASMCQTGDVDSTRRREPSMGEISMIGLDLAKNVFQVHGVDASGAVVVRRQLRRGQVEKFFAQLPACTVGLEACGSAHHWARVIGRYGHQVRLMPPAYVKPYVKRNKNDGRDAEAICEAVNRPPMRFVPV